MKRVFAVIILFGLIFSLIGCGLQEPKALPSGIKAEEPNVIDITEKNAIVTDFAVRLFQNSLEQEENTLISPVSVLSSLSMAANGADGNTLVQIEDVIGLPVEDLNEYMYSYNYHLSEISEENNQVLLNNSMWIKDDENLVIYDSFLQTNETYYGSSIYKAAFNDSTVKEINNWVKKNTNKMIPKIIDSIQPDTIMYLINTLVFEGEWQSPYDDVDRRDFEAADGTIQHVDFMHSKEHLYIENNDAVGFIKCYKDNNYALATLLPKERINIKEYVNTLTGEELHTILSNPKHVPVDTSMPKFTSEYEIEMNEVLMNMGMTDAFDSIVADFSALGHKSGVAITLDRILHKTHMDVNEKGTTAAAVASSEMEAPVEDPDYKVKLDRPFVYILMDYENCIPLFMGTVMSVE